MSATEPEDQREAAERQTPEAPADTIVAPDIIMDVADWGDNVVVFPLLSEQTDEQLAEAEKESKRLWGDDWNKRSPSLP